MQILSQGKIFFLFRKNPNKILNNFTKRNILLINHMIKISGFRSSIVDNSGNMVQIYGHGTLPYMAPEMFLNLKTPCFKSDIWYF